LSYGAVELIDSSDLGLRFEVEGSHGSTYQVIVRGGRTNRKTLFCTCPHFDEGNYCKHLWASILFTDAEGLFENVANPYSEPRSTASRKKKRSSRPAKPGWQKLLESQGHYLAIPDLLSEVHESRRQEIFYLLEVIAGDANLQVALFQRQMKKNGEWGVVKPLGVDQDVLSEINDASDRATLSLLLGNRIQSDPYEPFGYYDRRSSRSTTVEVVPELYSRVLPALCQTGRFVWLLSQDQDWDDARVIAWDDGPAWKFRLRAELFDRKRRWRIQGELVRGKEVRPLRDAVRCYTTGLLLMDDRLALFEAPADYRWVETLRANDELEIPTKQRDELIRELWRGGQAPEIVGDASLNVPVEVGTPVARLVVHPPRNVSQYREGLDLYANVTFQYGTHEASPNGASTAWTSEDGAGVAFRNHEAEAQLLDRLFELKVEPKAISHYGETPLGHVQFSRRDLNHVIHTLVQEGWVVEAEGARLRKAGAMSLTVRSNVDWFDLEGEIDFGGVSASLPELLAASREGKQYVTLGDGSRGMLPEKWIEKYESIEDLSTAREGNTLRFQPGQALLLDSLLASRDADVAMQVDRRFAALRKRLRSFSGVKPAEPPRTFHGDLRDYQCEGLGWLRFLEKFGFGGCLADDMGLGKTVQVLALLANRRRRQPKGAKRRPSLVVAPKSVVHNWRLEAGRFAPNLTVADYTGLDRQTRVPDLTEHDLVLTTYGTLRRDAERLSQTPWDYAILDEAQAIKNAASQSAKASRLLPARHRLALTGTPVENHLGELWSIFEFLNPGLLGKSKSLGRFVQQNSEEDDSRIQALRQGLAPFLLRRTKQQVLPQLPKKSEQLLYCDLQKPQRKQYDQLRDHYRTALTQRIAKSGLSRSKIHVLEALLRLRQAACHPGLINERQKSDPSAKLDLLITQLEEVLQEGHKALVFSQFTKMLDIVRKRLDKAGIVYEYLDGKTRDRQARVQRFQSDDACPVFLISLKAGGSGLNLTAADFVFVLDPWWNPAVEAQAIDRAHRIGQSRPVFAYRLIARDTVEEKILELQASKRKLVDAIIAADNATVLKQLTAEDLQALLS
jgi:superfamily II DNA or RNA helicase